MDRALPRLLKDDGPSAANDLPAHGSSRPGSGGAGDRAEEELSAAYHRRPWRRTPIPPDPLPHPTP